MDEAVRRWRQKATLQFWFEQNKRQGGGWHIATNAEGCRELEDVFEMAQQAKYPSRFTFALKAVASQTAKCPEKLVLSYNRDWPPDHWALALGGDTVELEVGTDRFVDLRSILDLLRKEQFDYWHPIRGTDQGLWVWWPLN